MRTCLVKEIFFIFFLTLVLPANPHGQSSSSQQNISEYEKKLTEISEQITDIRKKITKEEQRKTSVLSRLNKLGLNKTLIKKEISLHNTQLQKADLELSSIQKNIPKLKEKLGKEKTSIEKILVTLYKYGKFSYIDFLFMLAS